MPILKIKDESTQQWVTIASVTGVAGATGPTGPTGATGPTGPGVVSGGNSGQVLVKLSNTNYDCGWVELKSKGFVVTLSSGNWSDTLQTISSADFIATNYAYLVAPVGSSFNNYGEAGIYADDVTTDGEMLFHCETAPTVDINVNVVRIVV